MASVEEFPMPLDGEAVELADEEREEKPLKKAGRPREKKGRKLTIYIPEKVYFALVLKCYGRNKTVEQLVEELLIDKFAG